MTMFCIYSIEIASYVFSSSNHRYEKYVSLMMMVLLQYFHNFINVQYAFFLTGRMTTFWDISET